MTVQKWYVLGGFDYHGNLLVFFGFGFLVCRVSNFVRRYSRSGLESASRFFIPNRQYLISDAHGFTYQFLGEIYLLAHIRAITWISVHYCICIIYLFAGTTYLKAGYTA